MGDFSVFEYCYRDASNYKAVARLLMHGEATPVEIQRMRSHFESGEFFIAEQLDIPTLYAELWELSGGPTTDDHVWHVFENFRPANQDEISGKVFGEVKNLFARVGRITAWNLRLSPHWNC